MERRLGHDLSRVRIHADGEAAATAERFGARALTWGQEIWFGGGEYRTGTADGRRVLAHELAHTAQQARLGPRLQRLPQQGVDPGELERLADQIAGRAGAGGSGAGAAAAARPPAPPRGANPADCIEPLCPRYSRLPIPANQAEASARSQGFLTDAVACLRGGAAGSNASHHAEILANAEPELRQSVRELESDLPGQARRRGGLAYWLDNLRQTCESTRREVELEFRYNVVFEQSTALPWGYGGTEWNVLEGALSALPDEATWTNPRVIRFRREACHPNDVDPQTGACGGFGRTVTAGQADPTTFVITVFDQGIGASPYSRSAGLGASTTEQTLRHEVGHLVMEGIPQADRDHFFGTLLGWIDYSWDWINARDAPHQSWRDERERLRAELGFDQDQLDAWLATLQRDVPVQRGVFTYTRGPHHLSRVRTGALPAGAAFEYARSARGEYFAELYFMALSAPGFLHDALPAEQIEWLKRVVFGTPATRDELARQAALNEPLQSQFLVTASRLFTWPQIEAVLARLTAAGSAGGQAG